jgi:hypothetical protein
MISLQHVRSLPVLLLLLLSVNAHQLSTTLRRTATSTPLVSIMIMQGQQAAKICKHHCQHKAEDWVANDQPV